MRTWQPNLIVHDSSDFAAPVAADEAEILSINHSFRRLVPLDVVADTASKAGFPPIRSADIPRHLRRHRTAELPNRSLTGRGSGRPSETGTGRPPSTEQAPAWLDGLPNRPTVYVTLGTVFNDLSVFGVLLEALADVDCNVIATVGPSLDPAELAPIPENAHVERYISQSLVLPLASVAVIHGGSGSTLAALAHGLPMPSYRRLPTSSKTRRSASRWERRSSCYRTS